MKAGIILGLGACLGACLLACDPGTAAAAGAQVATETRASEPAGKLQLREGVAGERDGYVKIYGEVENGHDVPIAFVRIDITLYDENDVLIAEERTYASRRVVPAGERTPFMFTRDARKLSGAYHHHRLQVSAKPAPHGRTLVVEPETTAHEPTRILTTGTLRNAGTEVCVSPEVVVVGYAADGRVAEVSVLQPAKPGDRWDFVRSLGPGETAPFRISLPLRGEAIERMETFGSCDTDAR